MFGIRSRIYVLHQFTDVCILSTYKKQIIVVYVRIQISNVLEGCIFVSFFIS